MDTITLQDAYHATTELKRLANNLRLLNQWALNENIEKLENIANKHGMDSSIPQTTKCAYELLYKLAEQNEQKLKNTTISTDGLILLEGE